MRFVDADSHVLEPAEVWRSLPEWCRVRIVRGEHGGDQVFVGDDLLTAYYSLGIFGTPGARVSDYADPQKSPRLEDAHPGGFDPRARLADMDAEGIDAAVLLPSLASSFWGIDDPGTAARLAAAYNDWVSSYCAAAPDRLFAAAVVPLQDPALAVRELRRVCTDKQFRAAFVRPNPCRGRSIADPANEPFWEAAEAFDIAIAMHEGASVHIASLGADRLTNPLVRHAVSHPFEQMLACAQLMTFGVMERHPALRFVFLESGGGWAPFWIDRLDGEVEAMGGFCPDMRLLPSEYFARQCWISFEIDERMLPAVAHLVGEERIVWGSDYPHFDCVFPGSVKTLEDTISPLADAAKERIRGRNAVDLYRLPSSDTRT